MPKKGIIGTPLNGEPTYVKPKRAKIRPMKVGYVGIEAQAEFIPEQRLIKATDLKPRRRA